MDFIKLLKERGFPGTRENSGLVRHAGARANELWVSRDLEGLEKYQQNQNHKFSRYKYIVSFIAEPSKQACFIGVYENKDVGRKVKKDYYVDYKFEKMSGYEDLEGRAIIKGLSPRPWVRKLAEEKVLQIILKMTDKELQLQAEFKQWLRDNKLNLKDKEKTIKRYVEELCLTRKDRGTEYLTYVAVREAIGADTMYSIQTIEHYEEVEEKIEEAIKEVKEDRKNDPEIRSPTVRLTSAISPYKEFLASRAEKEQPIPEEISVTEAPKLCEGAKKQITVNAYERSSKARQECLKACGYLCAVCGFDFAKIYGELGDKYIHVHHIKPLSEIGENYELDPIEDLKPVCPNCHAMIHRDPKKTLTVEELKKIIAAAKKNAP